MAVKKNVASTEATETTAEETKTAEAETTTKVVKAEPKFAVGKLRENSMKLFGVSQSTFDGAMYGHGENEYTINEVKTIIDEWLHGKEGKK